MNARFLFVVWLALVAAACGQNDRAPDAGMMGGGETMPEPQPPAPLRFSEVAGNCAREALSGNIYCWGDQRDIAEGSGFEAPDDDRAFPSMTRLPPKSLTEIVGGVEYVCGRNVLEVWCIGDERVTAASGVPAAQAARRWVQIPLPTGVVLGQLAGGATFVCGIAAPNSPSQNLVGKVYCWGDNLRSQLGRGPGAVLTGVAPIASDRFYSALAAGPLHACATVRDTGQVECWGTNVAGEVTARQLSNQDTSPVPLARGLEVDQTPGTLFGLCGLKPSGAAWCWGDNFSGQMGNGTKTNGLFGENYRDPSEVPGFTWKTLSVGPTMCGITRQNEVYCWGSARQGSLGNGSERALDGSFAQTTPVRVRVPEGVTFAQITEVRGSTKCARSTDNRLFCWGSNSGYTAGAAMNNAAVLVPTELAAPDPARVLP